MNTVQLHELGKGMYSGVLKRWYEAWSQNSIISWVAVAVKRAVVQSFDPYDG